MDSYTIWSFQYTQHFYALMNQIFNPFIGQFVVVHFKDILVFCKTSKDHLKHLRHIFEVLKEHFVNLKKCEIVTNKVVFLGYVVSFQEIEVDRSKYCQLAHFKIPSWSQLHSLNGSREIVLHEVSRHNRALKNWKKDSLKLMCLPYLTFIWCLKLIMMPIMSVLVLYFLKKRGLLYFFS